MRFCLFGEVSERTVCLGRCLRELSVITKKDSASVKEGRTTPENPSLYVYRPVLGCRLTTSKKRPRKVGPTSGMGQCLARHVRQGTKE